MILRQPFIPRCTRPRTKDTVQMEFLQTKGSDFADRKLIEVPSRGCSSCLHAMPWRFRRLVDLKCRAMPK